MTVNIGFNQCPDVTTKGIGISGPQHGKLLSRRSALGLCLFAVNTTTGQYTTDASSMKNAAPCSGAGCCPTADTDAIDINFIGPATNPCREGGFEMVKASNENAVHVSSIAGSNGSNKVQSYQTVSAGPNTIATDLLPNFLVRVNKNGVDGMIDFSATDSNSIVTSWSVDTTGLDDDPLQAAIAAAFAANVPGLSCVAGSQNWAVEFSGLPKDPEYGRTTYDGPFVHCSGLDGTDVQELSITALDGMKVVQETTTGPLAPNHVVPTLSGWGMALLAATLLLMGGWLVRRKQAGQTV